MQKLRKPPPNHPNEPSHFLELIIAPRVTMAKEPWEGKEERRHLWMNRLS